MSFRSKVIYASGGQGSYAVPFPYMSKSHIAVLDVDVLGEATFYVGTVSWLNDALVNLSPDIDPTHSVEIRRVTPTQPVKVYRAGVVLSADLRKTTTQIQYLFEETQENATAGSGGGVIIDPGDGSVSWSTLPGKPSVFPPSAHNHPISDITNLATALDGKAASDLGNVSAAVLRSKMLTAGGVLNFAGQPGITLASPTDRASKYLAFDASGVPVYLVPSGGGGGGAGEVDTVNGIAPDVGGNVLLTAANVGAPGLNLATSAIALSTGESLSIPTIEGWRVDVLKFIPIGLHAAIRNGTSTANVASYIQEALDYLDSLGGGVAFFPRGMYRVYTHLFQPSNTILMGEGIGITTIKSVTASWTSALPAMGEPAASYWLCIILNKNWLALTPTDKNMGCQKMTIDHDGQVGGAHNVLYRMATVLRHDELEVRNTGGSGTAMLACKNGRITNSRAIDCYNSGFDHWDGSTDCQVNFSEVAGCSGQCIQFTGSGGFLEDRVTSNCQANHNWVHDYHAPSNFAVGIIFNCVDAGSFNWRGQAHGNLIENGDIGIALGGHGGMHIVGINRIKGMNTQSFIIQDEGTGEVPDDCVIDGLVIESPNDGGQPASIAIQAGLRHIFKNVSFQGSSPARRYWFNTPATGCEVHPTSGRPGGVADIQNGNIFYAYGGGSAQIVTGSDGSGPYTDIFAPGNTYRVRIRDNGTMSFNGTAFNCAGNMNAAGYVSAGPSIGQGFVFGQGTGYSLDRSGGNLMWRGPSSGAINLGFTS
ncbi:MAG: phage tail fiber protein [Moraxellaceae bacterium]